MMMEYKGFKINPNIGDFKVFEYDSLRAETHLEDNKIIFTLYKNQGLKLFNTDFYKNHSLTYKLFYKDIVYPYLEKYLPKNFETETVKIIDYIDIVKIEITFADVILTQNEFNLLEAKHEIEDTTFYNDITKELKEYLMWNLDGNFRTFLPHFYPNGSIVFTSESNKINGVRLIDKNNESVLRRKIKRWNKQLTDFLNELKDKYMLAKCEHKLKYRLDPNGTKIYLSIHVLYQDFGVVGYDFNLLEVSSSKSNKNLSTEKFEFYEKVCNYVDYFVVRSHFLHRSVTDYIDGELFCIIIDIESWYRISISIGDNFKEIMDFKKELQKKFNFKYIKYEFFDQGMGICFRCFIDEHNIIASNFNLLESMSKLPQELIDKVEDYCDELFWGKFFKYKSTQHFNYAVGYKIYLHYLYSKRENDNTVEEKINKIKDKFLCDASYEKIIDRYESGKSVILKLTITFKDYTVTSNQFNII
jgi:hypothetical protein